MGEPNGKNDLGLRFDLTVPLARYVSSNGGSLLFPFKRYQIAPVWRGERPQFGRYRQFYQCDIDIIGDGTLSVAHDAEIISIIAGILKALEIPPFVIKINNRKILCSFLARFIPQGRVADAVIIIDKIDKIPNDEFEKSLLDLGVTKDALDKIKNYLDGDKKKNNADVINWLKQLAFGPEFAEGVAEIEETVQLLKKLGIDDRILKISLGLARGLNYYTGTIFEVNMIDHPDIGSISGGGRYDNLTYMLSNKRYPGVGATIGISRLFTKLSEKSLIKCDVTSTADVLVTVQNREFLSSYMKIAEKLRKIGIKAEVYLQEKSLGAQVSYASRRGYKFVLIANEVELLDGKAVLRNLDTKDQKIIRTEYVTKDVFSSFK